MSAVDSFDRTAPVRDILVANDGRVKRPRSMPWLSRRQIIDLAILLDALAVLFAFILAQQVYLVLFSTRLLGGPSYNTVAAFAGLIHYVVTRSDQGNTQEFRFDSPPRVLRLLLTTFAALIVIGYGLKEAEVHSRIWLATSFAISFVFIALKNQFLHRAISKGRLRQLGVERIALYGDPAIAKQLKETLEVELDNLCEISVYDRLETGEHEPDSGPRGLNGLIANGLNNELSRVIFCLPPNELHKLKTLVHTIGFLPVRIEVCVAQAELQTLKDTWLVSPTRFVLTLDDSHQSDWGALFKRTIDVVLSCAFLVLAAPLMAAVAIAIKLDSTGPVFFRQRRHGWNHAIISVYKFRTMRVQEDGDQIKQAVKNDPRVTRVGRFLRKTSIDELPQFFNVISGEMSLVGPRPHALAHNIYYSELIESYAGRHKVKPGITGWAQVKGLRGNSEDMSKMVERAQADIWYIQNWSLLLDLKILLLTPFAILFHKNAL